MSELINDLKLHGQTKFPDHSLLQFCLDFPFAKISYIKHAGGISPKLIKYNLSEIPSSFLNDEESFELLNQAITNKESAISSQANIDLAYDKFTSLLQTEMETKLKKCRNTCNAKQIHKRHKSRAKPYCSNELQDPWHDVCKAEKQWLSCKLVSDKKRLREVHCLKRRNFNTILRKAKRNYQLQQQKKIHYELHDTESLRDFLKNIGKLGLSREHKRDIP